MNIPDGIDEELPFLGQSESEKGDWNGKESCFMVRSVLL